MICLNKGPGLGLQCQSLNSGRYTLGDRLQQLVALLVYWRIFVKVFVSTTEFCRRKMLQKIKSDRIYATCCSDKILLHCQRFFTKLLQYTQSDLSLRVVVATCCHNWLLDVICHRKVLLQLTAYCVPTFIVHKQRMHTERDIRKQTFLPF